jgi:cyclophilin family peptidyl-prolyl cis-trans isomerase
LQLPEKASPSVVHRVSALRCAAAARLAKGQWDADVLRGCDIGDGEAGESARLAAVDRGQIVGSRRSAWLDLARSKHVRVREAALEAIALHRELGDAAILVISEGLSSAIPGLVAKSADALRALPSRGLDPRIATALRGAMARGWTPDCVETRVALVDASLAAGVDGARAFAETACRDGNPTVRSKAAKALAIASCPAPDDAVRPAPEVDHAIARPVRVSFDTDAGALAVRFDPGLAPIAATRLVALARSGFYTGIAIHRVVPGFVVQLGDRDGDGYGGSGDSLRCETSPVPFERLDVGVALAGRDTGSSQMFVTLARNPQLDGQYAFVGKAEGDWDAVAEGDIVRAVRVQE